MLFTNNMGWFKMSVFCGTQFPSLPFRPQRDAHQAIAQSLEHINSGFKDIVDIDLKVKILYF